MCFPIIIEGKGQLETNKVKLGINLVFNSHNDIANKLDFENYSKQFLELLIFSQGLCSRDVIII